MPPYVHTVLMPVFFVKSIASLSICEANSLVGDNIMAKGFVENSSVCCESFFFISVEIIGIRKAAYKNYKNTV